MSDPETPTFVTHLECGATGERFAPDRIHNLSSAGKPLLVRYDLAAIRGTVPRDVLQNRPREMWRYRELLPVRSGRNIVRLGEIETPLLEVPKWNATARTHAVVKDEGRLPTGSFKARGLAMAVSMAKELGIERMAMPTNGNAGAALAAYAARAGIEAWVFCPDDTPFINVTETAYLGARTFRADGLIHECGAFVGAGVAPMNWFDTSTLKEPYRIEGKKTMGLELAEQYDWKLPDVIFYPTGGGTGLIGMWKAFNELREIGWLETDRLPRMVAVQATGCAPIVRAWESGATHAEPWENAATYASGIRVPAAIGDFLILAAIRESGGFALAVSDDAIEAERQAVAAADGVLLCPEGAATAAAAREARAQGLISEDDEVVLFNCATGLKYPMPDTASRVSLEAPDWSAL